MNEFFGRWGTLPDCEVNNFPNVTLGELRHHFFAEHPVGHGRTLNYLGLEQLVNQHHQHLHNLSKKLMMIIECSITEQGSFRIKSSSLFDYNENNARSFIISFWENPDQEKRNYRSGTKSLSYTSRKARTQKHKI